MFYLYVNRQTYQMVKCSPVNKPTPELGTLVVDEEFGSLFSQGHIHELKNYFITFDGTDYQLCKKELIVQAASKKIKNGVLEEVVCRDDADCIITLNAIKQTINIKLTRLFGTDFKNYQYTDMSDANESFTVYITKKNDPTYLLFCFEVQLKHLLESMDGVTATLPLSCSNVSIYTKSVMSSYSLEFINA